MAKGIEGERDDMSGYEEGQRVAVDVGGHIRSRYVIGVVDRITPSGRIMVRVGDLSYTFNPGGDERGSDYRRAAHLSALTPEIEEKIERGTLLAKIQPTTWTSLSTEQLRAIVALLD